MEVGGIGLREFCTFAEKIIRIQVDLLNLAATLEKRNKIYRFCSAPESPAVLESVYGKLSQMENQVQLLIVSVWSDVKVSVLLEAFEPVLTAAEQIIPRMTGLKGKQLLLADDRKAFGTHVLASRMNRLITRSTEKVYHLVMGKMFYDGIAVEVDYEKSASFFKCAIRYGNIEAYVCLGRQYKGGFRMIDDENKAVELFMHGAELNDPECL